MPDAAQERLAANGGPEPRGEWFILTAALLWSAGGIGVKSLGGWSPWTISAGRSLICGLLLASLAGWRLIPPRGAAWRVAAGAALYAFVVTSFVAATRWTTAANAILLQYTSPLWIAALGWTVARERPLLRELIALLAGGVGVALCVGPTAKVFARDGAFSIALAGDLLALASGLTFALLTLLIRGINRAAPGGPGASSTPVALQCLVYGNLLAALTGSPSLLAEIAASGAPGHARWVGWAILLWLGAGQLGAGYWFFQRGLRASRALTASLLCLIEPVLNPIWVALGVGEIPSSGAMLGGALVLCSVVFSMLARGASRNGKIPAAASP